RAAAPGQSGSGLAAGLRRGVGVTTGTRGCLPARFLVVVPPGHDQHLLSDGGAAPCHNEHGRTSVLFEALTRGNISSDPPWSGLLLWARCSIAPFHDPMQHSCGTCRATCAMLDR